MSSPLLVGPGQTLEVKSPLSKTIIISYDGTTKQTQRTRCQACYDVVMGKTPLHRPIDDPRSGPYFEGLIGDPIYFIGADVEYGTVVTPAHGRIAWANTKEGEAAIRDLISSFSPHIRKTWYKRTGTPFPHWLYK
jgi:hypothetical protein